MDEARIERLDDASKELTRARQAVTNVGERIGQTGGEHILAQHGLHMPNTFRSVKRSPGARRDGHRIARCTVHRLMRAEGLRGVSRAKGPRTTIAGRASDDRPDLLQRQFTAPAPDRVWVADITYCRTFAGWVYAAFVLDVYSRRVVGWQLSTSLRTDLALDALEMGLWTRAHAGQSTAGVIAHSDKGVQYVAIRYTQRLAEAGAVASVGSTGDSYDNAMAEAFNSIFKAELIRNRGPWRSIDDLEIAVAEYIDWYNHRRLHGQIGLVPPVEYENTYHRHNTVPTTVEASEPSLH